MLVIRALEAKLIINNKLIEIGASQDQGFYLHFVIFINHIYLIYAVHTEVRVQLSVICSIQLTYYNASRKDNIFPTAAGEL